MTPFEYTKESRPTMLVGAFQTLNVRCNFFSGDKDKPVLKHTEIAYLARSGRAPVPFDFQGGSSAQRVFRQSRQKISLRSFMIFFLILLFGARQYPRRRIGKPPPLAQIDPHFTSPACYHFDALIDQSLPLALSTICTRPTG
jgi:hypothetical protein